MALNATIAIAITVAFAVSIPPMFGGVNLALTRSFSIRCSDNKPVCGA